MVEVSQLPHVLAALNVTSVTLLAIGWRKIRGGDRTGHKKVMLGAVAVSIAFLIIYLYYHANSGLAKFGGEGTIRPIYFTLLAGHVLMAGAAALLVPWTLSFALRGRFERHRPWARWTLPLWLFVAASGVIVYVMAVHLFPYRGG